MDEEEQQENVTTRLKNRSKETKKKKRIKYLIKATPFIAILLIALTVISCFISLTNIIMETGQSIINSIVDFFKGDQTAIELTDEQVDQLIEVIEATGIDLEDLELMR